jgi:peptide/nickel transport system permease protein
VARVLIGRLALGVPMLLGMSVLVFLIIRLVPGDPVLAVLGLNATPDLIARLREDLGLNDPIYVQYVNWLTDLLRGDFGLDYRSNEPIGNLLLDRLPVTIELTAMALVMSIMFAIPLGVLAAVRRGRTADKATQGISLVGISVPDFWLGIMLILVFSLGLGILPSSGYVPFGEDPVENLRHMILPALALAAGLAAVLIRITRAAMLDVLHEDHIRFTRAKGVRERSVVFKHALRNAAIPIVTVVGLQAGYLLGGAIVIEQVFALPGVGRLVLDSVLQRNYPVVQASVLMVGLMFVLTNVAADLLYSVLNPKLRTASQ